MELPELMLIPNQYPLNENMSLIGFPPQSGSNMLNIWEKSLGKIVKYFVTIYELWMDATDDDVTTLCVYMMTMLPPAGQF